MLCSSDGGARHHQDEERQDGDGAAPKEMYKRVQSGGDIPAKGLQKPAPEKLRGMSTSWLPGHGVQSSLSLSLLSLWDVLLILSCLK